MNARRYSLQKQRGVSLVEVLIAVLIFSLGMIGLGGLLIFATQSNHVAFLRTQVTFLAHNMADRMSANPIGVWSGAYNNLNYPLGVSQDCSTGCTPADLAVHDQEIWSSQLKTFLPDNADLKATIDCDTTGITYTPPSGQLSLRPPYGGTCRMKITWDEHGNGDTRTATQKQTFAWKFQP